MCPTDIGVSPGPPQVGTPGLGPTDTGVSLGPPWVGAPTSGPAANGVSLVVSWGPAPGPTNHWGLTRSPANGGTRAGSHCHWGVTRTQLGGGNSARSHGHPGHTGGGGTSPRGSMRLIEPWVVVSATEGPSAAAALWGSHVFAEGFGHPGDLLAGGWAALAMGPADPPGPPVPLGHTGRDCASASRPSSARSLSNCRAAPPGAPVCQVIPAPAHVCAHEHTRLAGSELPAWARHPSVRDAASTDTPGPAPPAPLSHMTRRFGSRRSLRTQRGGSGNRGWAG